jgi:hypothetical protein
MRVLLAIVGAVSAAALALAVRANWRTALNWSIAWAVAAWLVMSFSFWVDSPALKYLALVLTGCAGVSVLGARRPGSTAWQFVVVGLFVMLLLPWMEKALLNIPLERGGVRTIFLAGLLGTVALNYLPTRLALPALAMAAAGAVLFAQLTYGFADERIAGIAHFCAVAAPALGWVSLRIGRSDASSSNRLWRDFRDRFGAIWALRVLDQFNRSAANAGSAARLSWSGVRGPDDRDTYDRLVALIKRFGIPAD